MLIVDDDALVRSALAMMLDGTHGIRVVGEAEVVVRAEVQHALTAGLHVRRLRRGELPLVLVEPGRPDLAEGVLQLFAHRRVHV